MGVGEGEGVVLPLDPRLPDREGVEGGEGEGEGEGLEMGEKVGVGEEEGVREGEEEGVGVGVKEGVEDKLPPGEGVLVPLPETLSVMLPVPLPVQLPVSLPVPLPVGEGVGEGEGVGGAVGVGGEVGVGGLEALPPPPPPPLGELERDIVSVGGEVGGPLGVAVGAGEAEGFQATPRIVHRAGRVQGAGWVVPPVQKNAGGQGIPVALGEKAAGQKLPGGAVQGPLQDAVVLFPTPLSKSPAAQGVGIPRAHQKPAGHTPQVAFLSSRLPTSVNTTLPSQSTTIPRG